MSRCSSKVSNIYDWFTGREVPGATADIDHQMVKVVTLANNIFLDFQDNIFRKAPNRFTNVPGTIDQISFFRQEIATLKHVWQ